MFAAESGWNLCCMELIYYDYMFKLQKISEERNVYFELKKNFLSFEVEGCIVNDSLMNISVSVNATFFIWPKLFFADCFPWWRFSCAPRAYAANSPKKKMQKFSGRMDFIVIFWMSFFALTFWNMLSWEKHYRSFCILDVHTGLLTHKLRKWNWLIGPLIRKRDVAYEVLLKKKSRQKENWKWFGLRKNSRKDWYRVLVII